MPRSIPKSVQIDWLTNCLDSFVPTISENVGPSISSDVKFVALYTAIQICKDNRLGSVNGHSDNVSMIVALLLRDGTPQQLGKLIYHHNIAVTRAVDIIDAVKGINLIILQMLDSRRPIQLFGESFIAERKLEAIDHILLGLLDAGRFVLKVEMNPTDRTALIERVMSGDVIESYSERVKLGKEMAREIYGYLRDELVKTGLGLGMKNLPRGHEKYILDLVMETFRLEAGFYGKNPLGGNFKLWKLRRERAAAAAEAAPKHGVRLREQDVQYNAIIQNERGIVVSTSDAPGLCRRVHEAYPLDPDNTVFDDSMSWNSMFFRIAVSRLCHVGQLHAIVRYTRDPMNNCERMMPPNFVEQIKSNIAEILASSNNENPTLTMCSTSMSAIKQWLSTIHNIFGPIFHCRPKWPPFSSCCSENSELFGSAYRQ